LKIRRKQKSWRLTKRILQPTSITTKSSIQSVIEVQKARH
jgi:hypothetical protein